MPRGNNHNHNRGRGSRGTPRGGRGGRGRGRGRGRGFDDNITRGGGQMLGGRNNYPHSEMDFVIQVWNDEPQDSPRRGGPWRGGQSRNNLGPSTPNRGSDTPRGRGRGRGRGQTTSPRAGFGANRRGGAPAPLRSDASLSKLLYSERPFLKPVIFVPSVYTKTLFQEVEDILQPVSESTDATEQSHVPTAERVARVFSAGNFPQQEESSDDSSDEEALEEIDFVDMAKLRAEVDAAASHIAAREGLASHETIVEETFTGIYKSRAPDSLLPQGTEELSSMEVEIATRRDVTQITTAATTSESPPTIPGANLVTPVQAPFDMDVASVIETDECASTTVEQDTTTAAGASDDCSDDVLVAADNTFDDTLSREDREPMSTLVQATSPSFIAPDKGNTHASHHASEVDEPLGFFIDTKPSRPSPKRSASDVILVDRIGRSATLGEEDELIVYVAPHPRSGRASPIPAMPRVRLPSSSILTGIASSVAAPPLALAPEAQEQPAMPEVRPLSSISFNFATPSPRKQPRHRPVFTSGDRMKSRLKATRKEARAARRRKERRAMFGSFGAMLSEARLRDDDWNKKDPQWENRRKDDSDIDWGDEDESEGDQMKVNDEIDEVSNGLGGMELDPDLSLDPNAMRGFVKGMGAGGSRHVTMDDIADGERMMQEDEEQDSSTDDSRTEDSGSEEDEEELAVFEVEEQMLIAESENEGPPPNPDDSDEEEDSSLDDDQSPKTGFQARLRKVREKAKGKKVAVVDTSEDESDDEDFPSWTGGDDDDDLIAQIETILEENSEILNSRDRKKRNRLFRAVRNGQFDNLDDFGMLDHSIDFSSMVPAKRKKNKNKDLPDELVAQWEKDRAKKAQYKRDRAEARLLASLDPFTPKKGGKKGRKAMLAAARLDPSIRSSLPHGIVDLASLEDQIRDFIANLGGKNNMVLPPMDKFSRKKVHELASAFNLKSVSKGKGDGRYTTLTKTTRTGMVNEGKVRSIIHRRGGGDAFDRPYARGKDNGPARMPRHKDGDEVGKAAPKIGETNIGFKMLASMGWTEGDTIGVSSAGLAAPLTAIIKNTKLGLGAAR
ncbi:hypothetical protein BV22DRAFT_167459 [Leucogyrophana mollusca]|uniref:Uncharacterized protein n=1 Tax=Leucogyrophana mollusca TaxID=85980 RepID=A0ACB8BU01_9AGAM|nr:hypothetical protein BV22DRAFT_167459 [Leucogyrophana mollusca]